MSGCVYFSIHYFNAVPPSVPSADAAAVAEHYECVAGAVFVYLIAVKCSASVAHTIRTLERKLVVVLLQFAVLLLLFFPIVRANAR